MNGDVLLAGAIGAVQGALAVWIFLRPRRLWQCCSVLTSGVAALLVLALRGDRRFTQDVIVVVALAVNVFCALLGRRRGESVDA
jgi:hypothetical protein